MCTAACLLKPQFAFGRTLDYDFSHGEQIAVTPRNFPLEFKRTAPLSAHFAMVGMAHIANAEGKEFPLYYDGVNEKGLAMAGLNFVGNAVYGTKTSGSITLAPHEFIPYILGMCDSLDAARSTLSEIRLEDIPFSENYPTASLHWIIADKTGAVTVESTKQGMFVYENPVGVLTNNPEFPQQLQGLADIAMLSPKPLKNNCIPSLDIQPYSRGLGAVGLAGDWSSMSRFKRCVFARESSLCDGESVVSQLFHVLGTVNIPRGVCRMENGNCHITHYTSVCHNGVYYYTTHANRQISAVDMHHENLDSTDLIYFNLIDKEQIYFHN